MPLLRLPALRTPPLQVTRVVDGNEEQTCNDNTPTAALLIRGDTY